MPSFAPPSSTFKLPTAGITQGVIAKFYDLGEVKQLKFGSTTDYENVPQIEVWWQLAEKGDDGKPLYIRQNYRFSEGSKANLTKFMLNLFGKTPEPGTFDYEKLVGIQRALVIEQYVSKTGKNRARISTTTQLQPNQAKLEIVPFVLPEYALKFPGYEKFAKGGVKQVAPLTGGAVNAATPIDDSDIPF